MTLNEILLPKLADWQPATPGRHLLAATGEDAGWSVAITADRCDALSCLLWEVTLRRTTPLTGGAAGLSAWAQRIAERVTGLMEPLKVIEVDPLRSEALLRSDAPTVRADKRFYYEVLLKSAGEAVLRRYQGSPDTGARRQQVGFALTHEVLAKVAGDLAAEA